VRLKLTLLPLALALVLAAGMLPLVDRLEPAAASPGREEVYFPDAPDPDVLRVGHRFFVYTTNRAASWGGLLHVPVMRSDDLVDWTPLGDAFPNLPAWAEPGRTWAPTVMADGNGFVLFYTATERASGRQCIGKARAADPVGPFVDTRRGPVQCQHLRGGSIDPYLYTDRGGTRYLLWKNDGNCCGLRISLWGQRLDDAERFVGRPHRLLSYDQEWERPLIENPAMVRSPRRGGPYRLFYSANWYDSTSYATGYARCQSPLGPCLKLTVHGPWHDTTEHAYGPGGASFFTDEGGRNWMALHGWARPPGSVGYSAGARRSLFVEKVDFSVVRPRVNVHYPYRWHSDPPHPYVDVPAWANRAVTWASRHRVITGYHDGPDFTFRPALAVDRAHAEDLLERAGGLVTSPTRGGRRHDPITRGQTARLLYRSAGSPNVDGPRFDHDLTDVPPALRNPVRWAVHDPAGLQRPVMTGFDDDTFRPRARVERAQYVRMLYRARGPG
jgi:Glycosyl hydrolases family 43/S-layer homology domain